MNLQDFACRISYIAWGGDLAWDRDGGLEELARVVESKFKESRRTQRALDGVEVCAKCGQPAYHHDPSCFVHPKPPRK